MISLFEEKSECKTLQFFDTNKKKIKILASPSFIAQLYYAEKSLRNQGKEYHLPIVVLNSGTFNRLAAENADSSQNNIYVVADPKDESARLKQLQKLYHNIRFIGLGRDLFPALVACNYQAVFAPISDKLNVHTATLLLATPRSGSSLLADLLTDIGAGLVVEHLRQDVIKAMKSDYVYDFRASLCNFLNFSSVNGYFGTKLIAHFLADFLTQVNSLMDIVDICSGINLKVIFLDREDKVAQTISGYLAAKRGVWHVTSDVDLKKLQEMPNRPLEFPSALNRYLRYMQQKAFTDSLHAFFPNAISLRYEKDLMGADLTQLATRLAAFVGCEGQIKLKKTSKRRILACNHSLKMTQEFRYKFRTLFGVNP